MEQTESKKPKLTKAEFVEQVRRTRTPFNDGNSNGYDLNENGGNQEQICYKSGKPCPYKCSGLCKDSY